MPDSRKKHVEIPFNGKLLTYEPASIGNNFRTLKNLRYTDTHLKGVAGNTKINATAFTAAIKTRNAHHFRKVQPAESHLLLQCYTTAETTSGIYQLTAAIPTTGAISTTALWTDSSGASRGYFCNAPDGQMIYANSVDTCIWGGTEMKVGACISSTAVVGDDGSATSPKDFTEAMQNTKTDADNICHIGGGQDSYCKLLCHFNGADADTADQTAATGQTISLEGNACLDTAYRKFGTASLLLDGTGDYCTVPDSADWYFAAGNFTIDLWYLPSAAGTQGFCGQFVDANNFWFLRRATNSIQFYIKSGGVVKASYSSSGTTINTGTWYHIELVRNSTRILVFINGVSQLVIETTAILTNEVPNLAAVLSVGACTAGASAYESCVAGWIDEFRISKGIARHTADFTVPTSPYLPDWRYFLIGSPRPLQGMKVYVSLANTVASTLTCKEWNGSTWNSLTITDNTDTGASFAQTGTITFSSTIDTSKPKYIEGYFLYWYQLYLDAGEAEIYHITLDAPFQDIIDLWDGQYRDIAAAYKMTTTARADISLKVLRDDYDSTNANTYSDLSSMAAYNTGMLEFGFLERVCGIHFRIPPEYTNSTAATTMSVDYWNGTEYVSVGDVSDGTSDSSISFARSGTVTWNNTNISDETKTNKMGAQTIWSPLSDPSTTESIWGYLTVSAKYVSKPLYFYRVRFNKAMDASVRLNYVGGIASQKNVSHYKFPIFAQGRILLCGDMSQNKNSLICSGKYNPQVYNGIDSVEAFIGDEGELTCGTELFSQYGGNLYSLILLFKDTEFWIIAGQDIKEWETSIFPISSSIGCPAPLTLKTITLSQEPAIGLNRSLAIWQGANGIYMSDGRAPIPIHNDIKSYFDKNDSSCIKASKVGDSVSFIDSERQEYHWLFASGTSATTLNKELVFDIIKNKWFEIDRGSGMYLQCGVEVQDTDGNQYTYGFIDTGYIERLEYGTSFDSGNIVHTVQFGDIAPIGLAYHTQLDHLKLITVAKTTTSNSITCTHYGDTYTTGTDKTMSPAKSNYRIAIPYFDEKYQATYHSFKFTMTTSDETIGFEPIACVATFHPLQED